MSHTTDSPKLQIRDPVSYGEMTRPLQVNAPDSHEGLLLPVPAQAPASYPTLSEARLPPLPSLASRAERSQLPTADLCFRGSTPAGTSWAVLKFPLSFIKVNNYFKQKTLSTP